MEKLRFEPGTAPTADPDERVLSDEELERAAEEGRRKSARTAAGKSS